MSRIFIITTYILAFCAIGVLFSANAAAKNFLTSNSSLSINIEPNGRGKIKHNTLISNQDDINIVTGYTYYIPGTGVTEVTAKLNGQNVSATVTRVANEDASKIDVNFGYNVVSTGKQADLQITATVNNFVKSENGIRYLTLPALQEVTQALTITYPAEFNRPTFVAAPNYSDEEKNSATREFKIETSAALFLIWGESYSFNVETNIALENSSSEDIKSLFQIIPDVDGQTLDYAQIKNAQHAVLDKFKNTFAVINVTAENVLQTGFSAKILKHYSTPIITAQKYEFGHPADHPILADIESNVEQTENLKEDFQKINDLLIKNFPVQTSYEMEFETNAVHWDVLAEKGNLSSFDYCFVIISVAENRGLKAQMNYGYALAPYREELFSPPHFWCLVEVGDETILIDPYMQQITGYYYFGITSEFDRITMGTWTPEQDYNNALGMLSGSSFVQSLKITNEEISISPSDNIAVYTDEVATVFSGFFHNLSFQIHNPTAKVKEITGFKYAGSDFAESLYVSPMLKVGLLPTQENKIIIGKLRNFNFLENGRREVEVEFQFDSQTIPSKSLTAVVNYAVHNAVYFFLVGAAAVIIIGIVLILKRYSSSGRVS